MVPNSGQATTGITLSQDISLKAKTINQEANAKVFDLSFGFIDDLYLRCGISIKNVVIVVLIH